MAEVDKAKAIKCAEEIGKNIKAWSAGKSTFTLAEIVPKWNEMDNDMRLVVGLEFRDKVAKENPDIVHEGQDKAGDDLYSVKNGVDIAKATECAEEIGKNIKTLAAGKSSFTLAEIAPKWNELDNDMRLVVGLEFRDKVVKNNPDIVLEGQTEAGDDLYSLK